DTFTFKVSDGKSESAIASIGITVKPVSNAPVARATISPLLELSSNQTNLLVLANNNSNALLILDGSLSFSPDSHPLDYLWLEQGNGVLLARGVIVTNTFELGTHTVT